jgi:hypothetical protein
MNFMFFDFHLPSASTAAPPKFIAFTFGRRRNQAESGSASDPYFAKGNAERNCLVSIDNDYTAWLAMSAESICRYIKNLAYQAALEGSRNDLRQLYGMVLTGLNF